MNCPRCEIVLLTERERDGILVDACAKCRGVWLDRGELEKLVTRALRSAEASSDRGARDDTPPSGHRYHGDGDGARREPRRKRSWLEDLFD